MNILLDDKKVKFNKLDMPLLIHGAEKTGASFFSICFLANLLKDGAKNILFSAYPMAREEFRKQINGYEKDAIIIDSSDEKVLIERLKNIQNLKERVLLIKNIDNYSPDIFAAVKDLELVIFSGDLDKCQFANSIINKKFTTKIFFSSSEKYPQYELSNLPKYHGKVVGDINNGIVSLDS